jgi:hypothetical protein
MRKVHFASYLVALLVIVGCSNQQVTGPDDAVSASVASDDQVDGESSRPERIELEGGQLFGIALNPEVIWQDPSGGFHFQFLESEIEVTGDLHGTGSLFQVATLNAGGRGGVPIDVLINAEWNGITGTFAGRGGFPFSGFMVDALISLDGSGGFEGMTFYWHITGPAGGPFNWDGYLLMRP